jgi:hypothetical protein
LDVSYEDNGSIVIFHPRSVRGRNWLEDNIGADNGYQPYWPAVVVERRYVIPILEGLMADGLDVQEVEHGGGGWPDDPPG